MSGIDNAGNVNTGWIFTYNQGTFIGSANLLYKITGTRSYYQDALRSTLYVKNSMCNAAGIFPPSTEDGGDGAIFNAIGFRWIAKFVKDQNLLGRLLPMAQGQRRRRMERPPHFRQSLLVRLDHHHCREAHARPRAAAARSSRSRSCRPSIRPRGS